MDFTPEPLVSAAEAPPRLAAADGETTTTVAQIGVAEDDVKPRELDPATLSMEHGLESKPDFKAPEVLDQAKEPQYGEVSTGNMESGGQEASFVVNELPGPLG